MVDAGDPWVTPFEASGGTATPRYEETIAWLRRLTAEAPELELVELGTSPQGRTIWMVVASSSGAFTPDALARDGKPLLLAHGGIHAGEIDGKDAGMMLLRDMTVKRAKAGLLDTANFLFIPVLNVDGHERFGPYHRINQRGPAEMGWRTNARNLNLNRDFAKLDTREVRILVGTLRQWSPDLYLDLHVTDGVDYQYDITFGYNGPFAHSPNSAAWLDAVFAPATTRDLEAMGHIPGPLVFAIDDLDLSKGITGWTAEPRYSNGYGDLIHLPTVLVENHSLKPYDQRVLGTYVLLESTLRTLGRHGGQLRKASAEDAKVRRRQVPLDFKPEEGIPPTLDFKGIVSRRWPSAVSGAVRVEWTGEPEMMVVPYAVETRVIASVERPKAYWIPSTAPEVIERLAAHGVEMETLQEAREVEVTLYRLVNPTVDPVPFEGRMRVSTGVKGETRTEIYYPGSVRVKTDQRLGDLVVHLLEPEAPDSFFRWGFFLELLQRTEYVEGYVVEPTAMQMMTDDLGLAQEFARELRTNPSFAADPKARLQWFYMKTPFFDERWHLYPVGREE